MANIIYQHLADNKFYSNPKTESKLPENIVSRGSKSTVTNPDLEEYKASLAEVKLKIGSIVMNCNPFTLGHRYLIEYASKQVSQLYIFVVEEDKSIFPFKDRLDLVKAGTADLKNVTVIPSGKFIISQLTFADYFNKADIQDKQIDPTQDLELFATEIAPTLNINVRFAGEEPLDLVTKQYNDGMARILPKHNIEFHEIPRKEENGGVISASRVRKHLDTRDWSEIEQLVPQTTLSYLKEKFK
uniref:[citrate (Pro-3S)-lyase] ligase n=1 Tax=Candidatus Enterococcus clewellii TaxID=1834193 RepID=A0A242JWZ7_9ENTE|nr:[citrate (Pro-3S)-lyase] ligase [Enterococcus sp. 9E7_DIV0242]